jgi:hypothetical protein
MLCLEQLEDRLVPSCAVVSGYVFRDANNNGLFDAGETPLAGAAIQLQNAAGVVIASAVTDATGAYAFSTDNTASTAPTTLTQTATVPTAATDWSATVSLPQFDPSLGTLTAVDIVNAGSFTSHIRVESLDAAPSTITATESGTLTLSGSGVTALQTSIAAGQPYSAAAFDGVLDFGGTSGHDFGVQTANGSQSTTLSAASALALYTGTGSVSFTEVAHATSGATGSGNLITNINTTAGAQVSVVYHYIPNNCLKPGNYTIVLATQPAGYLPGKESSDGVVLTAAPGTNAIPITLASSNLTHNDFAELAPSALDGHVYLDANRNGVRDAADLPLAGVTVILTGTNDLGTNFYIVQTTAADGSYRFGNLRPGVYAIWEVPPVGYLQGTDNLGSTGGVVGQDLFYWIGLGEGQDGSDYDFGHVLPTGSNNQIGAASSGSSASLSKQLFLASSGG